MFGSSLTCSSTGWDAVRRHVRQRISEVRMLRAEINNLFGVHRYVAIRIIFH